MTTLEDLAVKIGIDTDGLEQQADRTAGIFRDRFNQIAAGVSAAGLGLEAFARGQQDANIQTRQLAASLGISEDAMRDLALETANVGFPLNEVLDLMETGKQLGITSGPALREYAEFWDMVGDATGESATELGRAGVALASMGIEAGNEAEALSALGFIQEHSTQTIGDFLGILGRLGPDLSAAGVDVNETAALLAILEQEMGMTGRAARGALNEAITESGGTLEGLITQLGVSQETLDSYVTTVEGSSEVIQRNSDIVDESFTPLQRAQHWARELQYQYGDLAGVAGSLAMPLMALGPALGAARWAAVNAKLLVTKGIMLATVVATKLWAAAQWLLNAAMSANPIGLIIIAVIALIAIFVLLWMKCEGFRNFWKKMWDIIWTAIKFVWDWIKRNWKLLLAILTGPIGLAVFLIIKYWDKIKAGFQAVVDFTRAAVTTIVEFLKSIPSRAGAALATLWGLLTRPFRLAFDWVQDKIAAVRGWFDDLKDRIGRTFRLIGDAITAPFRLAFNAVSGFWNSTIGRLSWTVPSWVPYIGGNTISAPQLPVLHEGGIVPGRGDVPIMARGGEGVFTAEQMRAMGEERAMPPIVFQTDGRRASMYAAQLFAESIKGQGLQVVVR